MPGDFKIHGGIKISGPDLVAFEKFIKYQWKSDLETEMDKATGRAAKYILSQIRERILAKQYTPNSLHTARRKGYNSVSEAIPLVDTGGLIREALQTQKKSIGVWEVGVIGNKPSRKTGYPASAYVRALHEGFTSTVEIQGVRRTFRIPPRPFLRAVWEDMIVQDRVHLEWSNAIKTVLKRHGKYDK